MLLTFFTIAVPLLSSYYYGASAHHIDPSTNPNSTIESFSFLRQWSWTNADFDVIANYNLTQVMKLETKIVDHLLTGFGLTLTHLPSQEQLKVEINVERFPHVLPLLPNTSEVRRNMKSENLTQSYTWKRNFRGLAGVVKRDDDHKKVAYLKVETLGSDTLASAVHSKLPGTTNYTIITNGEVPLEVLISLYAGAAIRKDRCNW
ncbi:hypothetical protein PCASD_01033 [Puccinia coronata f. sp. avenae]|uniref:Uncharacterized protein n=1 Tax=Puccinia coronata f. sp. avenae TaxID=200324 RepID=A0A2N5VMN0_9BASI|nr:hypothetical protein PCASD_24710 [Puccinia coronata f. sp. avenae]PLW51252.1 hypothetical protein PCASD_01033 [Puccinia coronata f. sp. avenae]